jgi:hypothetical protein
VSAGVSDQVAEDLVAAVDAAAATFAGRGSVIKERELGMAIETALWTHSVGNPNANIA